MINVEVFKELNCVLTVPWIKNVVRELGRKNKKIQGAVEIIIIGDAQMRRLNQKYRHQDKTTDVLSFAWAEDKKITSTLLGQVYVSWPQIKRQAQEFTVTARAEFIRMLVHGMLHLVGYDHLKSKDAKIMFSLQEKYVKEICQKYC